MRCSTRSGVVCPADRWVSPWVVCFGDAGGLCARAATGNDNDPAASDLEQGEEQEQERRKLERQQRVEAKERATAANFELGRKLQLRYDTVKVTGAAINKLRRSLSQLRLLASV